LKKYLNILLLNNTIKITTERLLIKSLTINDVNEKYLSWVNNKKSNEYIQYSNKNRTLKELKDFVELKIKKKDTIFFGIFDKLNLNHIGNIKYEPINLQLSEAIMGIMIGDESYRGIGVAKETILSTSIWLNENLNICNIKLKVAIKNIIAIKTYVSLGFTQMDVLGKSYSASEIVMIKKINE
jgi:ribosomal-protein-alanine N-acetyltransferase|tara:strand:- start:2534 stop:3082 length:549 start_codon:yes stop_codon:yes gene_type:complete